MARFATAKEIEDFYPKVAQEWDAKGGIDAYKKMLVADGNRIEGMDNGPLRPELIAKNLWPSASKNITDMAKGAMGMPKALKTAFIDQNVAIARTIYDVASGNKPAEELKKVPQIMFAMPMGIGKSLWDAYGGGDKALSTLENDPFRVVNDISVLASGGKLAFKAAGMTKAAQAMGIASDVTNLAVAPGKGAQVLAQAWSKAWNLPVRRMAKANATLVRGLGLTPEKQLTLIQKLRGYSDMDVIAEQQKIRSMAAGMSESEIQSMYSKAIGKTRPIFQPIPENGIHGTMSEMETATASIAMKTKAVKDEVLASMTKEYKSKTAGAILDEFDEVLGGKKAKAVPELSEDAFLEKTLGGKFGDISQLTPEARASLLKQIKPQGTTAEAQIASAKGVETSESVLPSKLAEVHEKIKVLKEKNATGTMTVKDLDDTRKLLDDNNLINVWSERSGKQLTSKTAKEMALFGQDLRDELRNYAEAEGFSKEINKRNLIIKGFESPKDPTLDVINKQIRYWQGASEYFGELRDIVKVNKNYALRPMLIVSTISGLTTGVLGALGGAGLPGSLVLGTVGTVGGLGVLSAYSKITQSPRLMSWMALRRAKLSFKELNALEVYNNTGTANDIAARALRQWHRDMLEAFPALKYIGEDMKKEIKKANSSRKQATAQPHIAPPMAPSSSNKQYGDIISVPDVSPPSREGGNKSFSFKYSGQDTSKVDELMQMLKKMQEQQ